MRVSSTVGLLLSTWACLATAFTNPIKNGSDPQIAYHDGMYGHFSRPTKSQTGY